MNALLSKARARGARTTDGDRGLGGLEGILAEIQS
jgi:hypothetical protein